MYNVYRCAIDSSKYFGIVKATPVSETMRLYDYETIYCTSYNAN